MFQSVRRGFAAALAFMMIATSVLQAQVPEVLKQVPPSAPMVLAIPNLQQVSGKIAMLNEQLGLNQPQMQDALTLAKAMLSMNQGVRDTGGIAMVLLEVPAPNAQGVPPEPKVVLLVPITEYEAFLANFGVQPEAGVTAIELMGEPAFAKQLGNYAVLGDTRQTVDAYNPGQAADYAKLSGDLGGQVLTGSDLLVYADVAKIAVTALPQLEQALAMAEQGLKDAPPAEAAMAKPFLDAYGNAVRAFLQQGQAAVFGLDLAEQGLGLSFAAQFKDGTQLAQQLANPPADTPSFDRLPDRPFMVAASLDLEALPLGQWVSQLANSLPADHPFTNMLKSTLTIYEAKQVQQAMYPPAAGGAAPALFNAVNVYVTDEPAKLAQANREAIEVMNNLQLGQGATYQSTYTANALQVAGRQVDQYSLQLQLPPEQMAELGPAAMFLGQPVTGYVVTLDNSVIVTNGTDPMLLNEAIAAATGDPELNVKTGIANIRQHLPPHRAAEVYLGVGTILQMVGNFAAMFAPNMQFNIPADLPPVAITASVNKGGLLYRNYVPMEVIRTLTELGRQLNGGAQPGQPGHPGQPGQPQFQPGAGAPAQPRPMQPQASNKAAAAPAGNPAGVMAVSDADFHQAVMRSEKPVVIDFYAAWSGPCKVQSPIIDEIAAEYGKELRVVRVDVDQSPRTPQQFQVQAVPTLLIVKDGQVVQKFVGLTKRDTLDAALAKLMN